MQPTPNRFPRYLATNRNYLKLLNPRHKHVSTVPHLLSQRKARKQPPEMLCKKRCSWKCCKIHRKTTVLEPLFNKVAG